MPKVRIARIKDADSLANIDKLWKKESVSPGFRPRTKKQFIDAIKKNIVIVAENGDAVIGYALGSIKISAGKHINIDQDIIHINEWGKSKKYVDADSVFVLKNHRNKGIGKMLIEKLIDEVKTRGIRRILLAADNKENPEKLIGFYKNLGFRIVVTYFDKKVS
jgi:GNAT superfamily N-acetyltransferase